MRALIFDTETTGLIENRTLPLEKQPEVIEFYGALVNLKTGKKVKEVYALIRPSKPLPEIIMKITGLTDADLLAAPPFATVAPLIYGVIEEAPLVVAHNLSFDKEMLDIECERALRPIKWPRGICTVEQTIHLKGFRLSQMKLHELLFGEGFEEAHRAKPDTQALIRIAFELFKRGLIRELGI